MNYQEECYAYIKARPGCRTYEIWHYLDERAKEQYASYSPLKKWLVSLPVINIFTDVEDANLARCFAACEVLEEQGFIRHEVDTENKLRFYPTGRHRPAQGYATKLKEAFG